MSEQESTLIKEIYSNWMVNNGCTTLLEIKNRYSVCDGIVRSGNTDCLLEHKYRYNSIAGWNSVILEQSKYNNLVQLANLYGHAPILYCMEYQKWVLIYVLKVEDSYAWNDLPAPRNSRGDEMINKAITFLNYSDADYIISKVDWKTKTINELNDYINAVID